ncbi:hypothetical protein Tco_1499188 [Tanacetum coccineum]
MALSPSLGVFTYGTDELSQANGPNFKVNWSSTSSITLEGTSTLVVPGSPTFPKDSINPCDGSRIATLNKRLVGQAPLAYPIGPDCVDLSVLSFIKSLTSLSFIWDLDI